MNDDISMELDEDQRLEAKSENQEEQHRYVRRKRTGKFTRSSTGTGSDDNEDDVLCDEEIDSDNGNITSTSNASQEEGYKKRRTSPQPDKPKRSVSDFMPHENTGAIHVGKNYQVIIPECEGVNHKPKVRPMVRTWVPGKLSNEEIDDYLDKAMDILRSYIDTKGLSDCLLPVPASPIFLNEDFEEVELSRKPYPHLRESCQTALLTNLHTNNYNIPTSLSSVQSSPSKYLHNLLTKSQQYTFNSSFRQFCGALRLIQKETKKSHQEVIDYFYRFKIPDQFRKFQEKKREQAMDTLDRMVQKENESSSSSSLLKSYDTNVNERKVNARVLLSQVYDVMGEDGYLKLGRFMKEYYDSKRDSYSSIDRAMKVLKKKAFALMDGNEELCTKFLQFLPIEYR